MFFCFCILEKVSGYYPLTAFEINLKRTGERQNTRQKTKQNVSFMHLFHSLIFLLNLQYKGVDHM